MIEFRFPPTSTAGPSVWPIASSAFLKTAISSLSRLTLGAPFRIRQMLESGARTRLQAQRWLIGTCSSRRRVQSPSPSPSPTPTPPVPVPADAAELGQPELQVMSSDKGPRALRPARWFRSRHPPNSTDRALSLAHRPPGPLRSTRRWLQGVLPAPVQQACAVRHGKTHRLLSQVVDPPQPDPWF